MPANDEGVLAMRVRDLLERATKLIIRESERFPNFEKRIDLEFELELNDPKIGRKHRVRTKLRITSYSALFDTHPTAPK